MPVPAAIGPHDRIKINAEIVAIIEEARLLGLPKKSHDKLLDSFASNKSEIDEKNRRIAELEEEIRRLKEENGKQLKKIEGLKATPRKTSRNSSRPPSSDPPSVPKRAKKKRSQRKPGGQPGHKGNSRNLAPEEKVNTIVDVHPDACNNCGKTITEDEKVTELDPVPENRHQIVEIPKLSYEIIEYRRQFAVCGDCKAVTRATLPENVLRSGFGPNLMALVVLLTGAYFMSKRSVASLLSSVFGIVVAVGTISNIERRVSKALRGPVAMLHHMIRKAKVVYADETSWKECARRVYLWVAATTFGAVFYVRRSRAATVAMNFLGHFEKVVVTDRYKGYSWIPLNWRQICWAHLKRDFEWIAAFPGVVGRIGRDLLACERELFVLWGRVKDGKLQRSSFRTLVSPIRAKIRSLLQEGKTLKVAKVSGMCAEMLKVYPAFYTFVRVEGVEPTNNTVEQRQRGAAIWRRISFGTWSRQGSEYVGHILSVVTTLKIQKRPVLPYLQEVCAAVINGKSAPLLLPMDTDESNDRAA